MLDQAWIDMMKRIRAGKPGNAHETMLVSEFDKIRALLRHVDWSDVPNHLADEDRVASATAMPTGLY
jgi:hypothetical protein